jgi:RimJ/RimL family protein N-acetyltransferase
MKPDFEIVTQRLELKLIPSSNAEQFARLVADSYSLHRWMDWTHRDFGYQEALDFIQSTRLNWVKALSYGFGVYLKGTEELAGMVAITEFQHTTNMASIGYWIGDRYQKKGYGKEALEALIEFSFSKLQLTRLEIVCDPDNIRGHILALKCGATEECLAKNRYIFNDKPRDGLVFSVVPQD